MWIRLRFDIASRDLISGMLACCIPMRRPPLERQAERCWSESRQSVVCLSVRSGFDLLLSSLRLPPQSEVLMSAVTVPDMQRIVRHHGLVPVPVDLVPDGCAPSLESLRRGVTRNSRVLVIAHLFGMRVDMDPILELARRHNLFVIEDCAQAYDGRAYRGNLHSDASLFSFGPIKTATALGGGVVYLKSAEVAQRVREIQQSYDVQSRRSYFCRLVKYSLFKMLASRPFLDVIARACRVLHFDLDALVAGAARNFPAEHLIEHLRRQPCAPLLKMLLRRWCDYDSARLLRRIANGEQLIELLSDRVTLDQRGVTFNNYWVFPILVDDQLRVVNSMRSHGVDATSRSRLSVVEPPADRRELQPRDAITMLARVVFLPCYPEISTDVLTCMARLLGEVSAVPTPERRTDLASRPQAVTSITIAKDHRSVDSAMS